VHRLILRTEQDQARVRASVGAPVDDEGAANGYALWETLEDAPALDSGPIVTPDPLEDWYDEPAKWERWPLPELPAGDDQAHDDGDQDAPESDEEPPVPDVPADVLARARQEFSEHLQSGRVPGVRPIREALGCGQARAQQVRDYLAVLVTQ
jgi:hypothetical protein